jgi:hypothetical protein
MASKLYTERKLERKLFGLRSEKPKATLGQALVLTGAGGTTVLMPDRGATTGELVWGGYDTVYVVDMGSKDLKITCSAPATGGDVTFKVTFSAGYRVSDPAAVVNRRIDDPAPMLQRVITEAISRVTSSYDIEKGQEALAAVRVAMERRDFGEKVPFAFDTVNVELELDAQAKEFLRKRREQRQQAILAKESSETTVATAEADQLKRQYELEATRKQKEFDMEMARRQVEMELQIQKMRMEVYKPMIEGGLWSVLVQQLAQNPGDIGRVTDMILQVHSQKVQGDVLMLKTMLDGDMIEDRHLKDITAGLVRNLEQNLRGGGFQLGGPPDVKALPARATDAGGEGAPPSAGQEAGG